MPAAPDKRETITLHLLIPCPADVSIRVEQSTYSRSNHAKTVGLEQVPRF